MNNWFICLPDELIHRIAFYLPLNKLNHFCLICIRFDKLISNNNLYWIQRFIFDIGIPSNIKEESWRDTYRNFGQLLIIGDFKQHENIKAKKISCGSRNTMILDVNNNIYLNKFLLSFHGAKSIACGNTIQLFTDANQNVWSFENDSICLINNLKAKYISCGDGHAILIDLNDQIWALGNNDFGQCGINTELNYIFLQQINDIKIKFVSCGDSHTVMIDMEDKIWVFGDNEYGQLGLGDLTDRHIPLPLISPQGEIKARVLFADMVIH
jgi:alpha-tubulin suppressor-like RCC1 family protein